MLVNWSNIEQWMWDNFIILSDFLLEGGIYVVLAGLSSRIPKAQFCPEKLKYILETVK